MGSMMSLTANSDHSLRLLMYLAARPDRLSTIPEVARAYGISTKHLMKVAHQLGQAGHIATMRGRDGGLRLKRSAPQIGLGAVVRHTEPDMDIVPCSDPPVPAGTLFGMVPYQAARADGSPLAPSVPEVEPRGMGSAAP